MAIVLESVSSTGADSTTIGCPAPSGLASGDLLIAYAFARDGSTAHGGWSVVGDGWNKIQASTNFGGAAEMDCAAFWKIANATNATASSFTFLQSAQATNTSVCIGMSRWSGHNSSSPIDVSMIEAATSRSSGAHSIGGSITPTHSSATIVLLVAGNDDTLNVNSPAIATDNPTWSSGYLAQFNLGFDCETAMWYGSRASSAATGTGTYVIDTNDASDGVMLFIEPPDGGGGGGGGTKRRFPITLVGVG